MLLFSTIHSNLVDRREFNTKEMVILIPILTCGSLNRSTIFWRFLIDMVPSRRTYWYLPKMMILLNHSSEAWSLELILEDTLVS